MDYEAWAAQILEKHAPIAEYFGSGYGLHLQRIDSEIARGVINAMTAAGIPTLGVHDSFICDWGYGLNLEEAMEESFQEVVFQKSGIIPTVGIS